VPANIGAGLDDARGGIVLDQGRRGRVAPIASQQQFMSASAQGVEDGWLESLFHVRLFLKLSHGRAVGGVSLWTLLGLANSAAPQ